MTTATRTEPPNHNTLTCYTNYRCRRSECVDRYNRDNRERQRSKAAGTYDRLVDAAPVRAHVKTLIAAGATPHGIATRAGVSNTAVRDLLPARPGRQRTPTKYRMSNGNARKILAVTPADLAPPLINATGTVRRIQALTANGWPLNHLAQPLGLYHKYIYELLRRTSSGETTEVLASTAQQVARAYEQLCTQRPTRSGVSTRSSAMAKRYAADRRWPTSKYWDQYLDAIDDPDFAPEYKVTRGEVLAAEARWLINTGGLTHEAAAERLGITREHLYQTFKRHSERNQLEQAA